MSTDSEDQLNSYQNQQSFFEREIVNRGHTLYKIYADRGLTGTKLSNRPEFENMLNDAGIDIKIVNTNKHDKRLKMQHMVYEISDRKPMFDEIWMKNTSRFARNTLSYEIINLLRQKNVNLYFLEQNINSSDMAQDLLLKLLQVFDEQDSKDKSLKVRSGIAEGVKKGIVRTNGKLYGYKYIKSENRLEVIPKEAKTIKLIFEQYSCGKGIRQIINFLADNQLLTRNEKPFCKSAIKRIITNEKYAGLNNPLKYDTGIVMQKYSYAKVKSNYQIIKSNKIPPIVSEELFNKCQFIFKSKINYKNQLGLYKGISKYSGLIYCAKCGSVYHSNQDKGRIFYNCSNKKSNGLNACNNPNISELKVDKFIDELAAGRVNELIKSDREFIKDTLFGLIKSKFKEISSDKNAELQEAQAKIEEHEKILSRLYELYSRDNSQKSILLSKISTEEDMLRSLYTRKDYLSRDNDKIYSEIKSIYGIYLEATTLLRQVKEKYTHDEVIGMLSKIVISDKRFNNTGVYILGELKARDKVFEFLYNNNLIEQKFLKIYSDCEIHTVKTISESELQTMLEKVKIVSQKL